MTALPDHRVIAPDLRGLGWTSAAPDGDYRKAAIAADQIALLDALGIERALLVAHDWGAWVGWYLALNHPERFAGYVATGIVHPWNKPAEMLREARRFLYQPPIAAPILGPLLIPNVVTRILRGAWGDRETYDRAAEPIFAEPYKTTAGAASQYYRQFLTRELLRGPTGRLDDSRPGCCRAGATRSAPGSPKAWTATATTRSRCSWRAAGTSCPRSGRRTSPPQYARCHGREDQRD